MKILDHLLFRLRRPIRQLYRILSRWSRYDRLVIQNWEFWGPSDFIASAASALRQLRDLDAAGWDNFAHADSFVIYSGGRRFVNTKLGVYSINKEFLAWGDAGVITFCIYINYRIAKRTKPERATGEWLESKGFPAELVSTFKNYCEP